MGKASAAIAPLRRRDGLVTESTGIDGGLVVFDTSSNQAHALDAAAVRVWHACDGVRSSAEVALILGIDSAVAQDTIARLGEIGLVTVEIDHESAAGHTRRTMLRRAAAAGLVAVPIITTVDVPMAAAMVSGGVVVPTTLTLSGAPFGDANGVGGSITYQVAPNGAKTTLPVTTNDSFVSTTTGAVTTGSEPSGANVEFRCFLSGGIYTFGFNNNTSSGITYDYSGSLSGNASNQSLPSGSDGGVTFSPSVSGSVVVHL